VSWGTPNDPNRSFVNSTGETLYPFAQKVSAVAEIGDRVYIGGEFTDLVRDDANRTPSGVPLAYLAELDTNGIPVPGSRFNATVRLDGAVKALYRSPDGRRLYVGGDFRHVNGVTRPRLVALDPATGEIDWSFNPPEPSGFVGAIAQSGSRLYIAGGFARLGLATKPQLAALDAASGALDTQFVPPPRYPGRFEGHTGTRNDNPVTNGDPTGAINSLLVTPGGQYLMVGGSFLHFGYDHTADPEHRHSGLIAIDPATGALTVWQPDQGSNSSRPVFGMTAYPGDPRSIGVDAPVLIFTASGGAGGRLLAWVPGKKTTRLWRGSMDGDVMAVAASRDRVYVVGHFDHTVPDPSDPCLKVRDL
jgi:outer membrane protein assembly factor BamB